MHVCISKSRLILCLLASRHCVCVSKPNQNLSVIVHHGRMRHCVSSKKLHPSSAPPFAYMLSKLSCLNNLILLCSSRKLKKKSWLNKVHVTLHYNVFLFHIHGLFVGSCCFLISPLFFHRLWRDWILVIYSSKNLSRSFQLNSNWTEEAEKEQLRSF